MAMPWAVLREYLVSAAVRHKAAHSTRALAVTTGEQVAQGKLPSGTRQKPYHARLPAVLRRQAGRRGLQLLVSTPGTTLPRKALDADSRRWPLPGNG